MSRRSAYIRVLAGLIILASLYFGPLAFGMMTAGDRVAPCLHNVAASNIKISVDFIPGPSELEFLQTFGRYGGSGGDLNAVILLGVPEANLTELSRIYWIRRIEPEMGCP